MDCVPNPGLESSIVSPGTRYCGGFNPMPTPGGGAGADEVTGLKRLILREVFNDARNVENHRCRRPGLPEVAVHAGLQRVVLRCR